MRHNLADFASFQVFLNYPFDVEFAPLADAMSFAVVAGGLLPVCAIDLTTPDRPRLDILVDAITSCRYSAHDLSRGTGEGAQNFARMNMPLEMGMALFHALHTQLRDHRCLFFVAAPHEYQTFASDLSGLDPKVHNNEDLLVLSAMYDWLRDIVPPALFNAKPTIEIVERFAEFKLRRANVKGGGPDGSPTHAEAREVMYRVCSELGWWDWRENRMGRQEFPELPLAHQI